MKKLTLLFGLFLSVPLFAQEQEAVLKDLSGGMNSYQSANKIPDNTASYLQNFLTDIEPIAVERNGYIKRDSTVLGGTKPVYGLWEFVDTSGNDWIISYSSRTYYKNTIGTTPTAFGPTATVDTIPDCAKNLGKIMCVNGTDSAWTFNGTSTATVSGAPAGQLIEAWRTRFAIGNINGAKSTIRFSADGDETNWTLAGNPTDPFAIQIGGANDGEYVRCMKGAYLDTFIVGRKYDLWGMDGFDQSDISVRNISDRVGCIEPRTMAENDGELLWLSARGVEAMTNRSIQLISEPIRNITDVLVKNTANQRSLVQTSADDWGTGTFDNLPYVDTTTYSGRLLCTFPDPFDYYRDGTSGTKKVWQQYRVSGDVGSTATANGTLNLTTNGTYWNMVRLSTPLNLLKGGTTIQAVFNSIPGQGTGKQGYAGICISSYALSGASDASLGAFFNWCYVYISSSDAANNDVPGYAANYNGSNDYDAAAAINVSTQMATPFTFSLWIATNSFNYSVNNVSLRSGAHHWPSTGTPVYVYFGSKNASAVPTPYAIKIDDFGVAPETFTYTSPILTIGSLITSWGAVTASVGNSSAGNIGFQIGSTNTASVSAISNYTTVINNAVPTISTNPYAGDKFFFQQNVSSATPYLDDFTISWNEGGVNPSPVSNVYDRRYWISFTTSSVASPVLDSVGVWQRTRSWTLFKGIYAGSFSLWRDYLYFGNSNSTGYVYKYDVGDNDDGSDISSQIVTKSYDLEAAYRDKYFRNSYLQFLANPSYTGSFTVTYDLDRLGQSFSLGSVSMNEGTGQLAIKLPFSFSNPVQGREIQYRIAKSGTGQRLKLHDLVLKFTMQEER